MAHQRPVQTVEQDREMEILYRVIQAVSSSLDTDEILAALVRLVSEATGSKTCFVYLWDAERNILVLRAAPQTYALCVGRLELRPGEGVVGWAVEHRESVLLQHDPMQDPRYKYFPELEGEKFAAMLSVPIISRSDTLIGAINVHAPESGHFNEEDRRFLEHTASLVAGSIENARLFEALAGKERVLAALVRKTILAQEEERRRVATEIHDGVTQQLVSIWYRTHACQKLLERNAVPGALKELQATKDLVDETLADARSAVFALRPATLDDLGLAPSLHTLAERFAEESGIEVDLQAPEDRVRIPPHLETALYRITQETLTNIKKHSGATKARVQLCIQQDTATLEVADNGRGFDVDAFLRSRPQTSFGLTGMRERVELVGGRLRISSPAGGGTLVSIRVALRNESGESPA